MPIFNHPARGRLWLMVVVIALDARLCPTACNPMGCSPPGSSAQGILQARMLEWVAIPFSKGESSRPRDQTQASCVESRFIYYRSHQKGPVASKDSSVKKLPADPTSLEVRFRFLRRPFPQVEPSSPGYAFSVDSLSKREESFPFQLLWAARLKLSLNQTRVFPLYTQ